MRNHEHAYFPDDGVRPRHTHAAPVSRRIWHWNVPDRSDLMEWGLSASRAIPARPAAGGAVARAARGEVSCRTTTT